MSAPIYRVGDRYMYTGMLVEVTVIDRASDKIEFRAVHDQDAIDRGWFPTSDDTYEASSSIADFRRMADGAEGSEPQGEPADIGEDDATAPMWPVGHTPGTCPKCGKKYKTTRGMADHVESEHQSKPDDDNGGMCGVIADDEIADNPESCNGDDGPHACTNLTPCDGRHRCNICGYDLVAADAPRTSSQAGLASIRPSLVQLDQDDAAAHALNTLLEWQELIDRDGPPAGRSVLELVGRLLAAARDYRDSIGGTE